MGMAHSLLICTVTTVHSPFYQSHLLSRPNHLFYPPTVVTRFVRCCSDWMTVCYPAALASFFHVRAVHNLRYEDHPLRPSTLSRCQWPGIAVGVGRPRNPAATDARRRAWISTMRWILVKKKTPWRVLMNFLLLTLPPNFCLLLSYTFLPRRTFTYTITIPFC